ncbi:MAG: hypothetical protein Q3979_03435 [Actinomycetaceae bacterium]|nr:hypothetical protein [Actinomycetaceae bacterium]
MNKFLRFGTVASALLGVFAIVVNSATEHSAEETFALNGKSLNIVNVNSNMPIRVVSGTSPATKAVSVKVDTRVKIQTAQTPAWSLDNGDLNLDTPCGGSIIGYCQASYLITVPTGTEVSINGKPAAVN